MKVFLVNLLNTKISIDEQLIEIIDFFIKWLKKISNVYFLAKLDKVTIIRQIKISSIPIQPIIDKYSPTINIARIAAITGSSRVMVVAILAEIFDNPKP